MSKIALISFTDPRKTALSYERENTIKFKHNSLKNELVNYGFDVLDINEKLLNYFDDDIFGIFSKDLALKAGTLIVENDVCCIILGLWHWTESNLVTTMLRITKDIPIMLYCDGDPAWAGPTCISSVGASLWETTLVNKKPNHYRLIGNAEILKKWINSMITVHKMKRYSIVIFGAPYTLGMEHLMDDIPFLKKFVEDIIMLDQYLIIKKAQEILNGEPQKISEFVNYLSNKSKIKFDNNMLTKTNFEKQVALYIATKEILRDMKNVAIISLKCQPELSEIFGVTGCLIPAFLNSTCEGDLKGTISSMILQFLSNLPALFGDIKYISDDYIFIANCGASSIFYAKLRSVLEENLDSITIEAQCQGAGGGAVKYRTPPTDLTALRLTRINNNYFAQYFNTKSIQFNEEMENKLKWGRMWPHTAIINPLNNSNMFINLIGANHLSLVPGNFSIEIKYVFNELGINSVCFNSKNEVDSFCKYIGYNLN